MVVSMHGISSPDRLLYDDSNYEKIAVTVNPC